MSWVGCYSMDLYCDNWKGARDEVHGWGKFPAQYTGDTRAQCAAQARRAGWLVGASDRRALCPLCRPVPDKR